MDTTIVPIDKITGPNGGTWNFLHQITYGEMLIAVLLVLLIAVNISRIIFDVLREWW